MPLGGLFTGWISGRFGTWLYLLIVGGVSVLAAGVGAITLRKRTAQLPERRLRAGIGGADASTFTARE